MATRSANLTKRIRQLLRDSDDGLKAARIAKTLRAKNSVVNRALRNMPDSYIDRWEPESNALDLTVYRAVWCVVIPPANCPHPTKGDIR